MTKNETVGLAVRIAAILLIYSAVNKAVATIPVWNREGEVSTAAIIFMLLPLALAVVMWKCAFSFTKYLLPSKTEDAEVSKWGLSDIQETAYTIIGVYVLSGAIPDGAYLFSVVIQGAALNANFGRSDSPIIARSIITTVKLIIGFWLMFGANGLCDFLRKVKTAGQRG